MRQIKLLQGSEEWLAERRKHETASEASAMMGASKAMSRTDLITAKKIGLEKEQSKWVEEVLFPRGHEIEAEARPIAEAIVKEELYPLVGIDDDTELLASFDGITMLGNIVWECKQWNEAKAADVRDGNCPIEDYWQVVQQLLVSKADRCLYMVTDGTEEKTVTCWVERSEEDESRLIDGWNQFDADLKDHVPPEPEKPISGTAPEHLPALDIRVTGSVVASNLDQYKAAAIQVFQGIKTDLETDQDFADADATVKWCKQIEKKLDGAKDAALSQTADIYDVLQSLDEVREQARQTRLTLEKSVKAEKERRKVLIYKSADQAFNAHIEAIQTDLQSGTDFPFQFPPPHVDISGAMKGKKTINSLQDAADTAVANAKIEADQLARTIRASIDALQDECGGFESLFPDAGQLVVAKTADDIRNLAKARIGEHQKQERQRQEREAEAKRQQEEREAEIERQHQNSNRENKPDNGELHDLPNVVEVNGEPLAAQTTNQVRPSDAAIIEALALHFRAHEMTVIGWLADMDLKQAIKNIEQEEFA